MVKVPRHIVFCASAVMAILAVTAGVVVAAAGPTVVFDTTIAQPATPNFDISFVKNDVASYILADRTNNAVDLFNTKTLSFVGGIGSGGFVGVAASCDKPRGCSGPNGDLIDNNNHVWAGDGPGSSCSTAGCRCSPTTTTSMVKEYVLAPSSGTAGRLACLDTGGKFRADEMAFDPRDDLLLVANDFDGFLSLISTSGTPAIVDKFYYADNSVGKPASARGLSTPGGGIEQPVWNPHQGFFYLAVPQGTTVGRVDIFNPKAGKLVFLRSIDVSGCTNGPTGLAINASDELLGACDNGAALIDANSGKVSIISDTPTLKVGGADQIWFDAGSNAWYLSHSTGGLLPVVSAGPGHGVQNVAHAGCCGHSIAAYTASGQSFIFDPNGSGTGISVFSATP